MPARPRVVYWDNLPAPYAVERFNALADRGTLDFRVWFSRRTDPDRRWNVDEAAWRFDGGYVQDPSRGLDAAERFAERCETLRPDLVVALHGEPPFVVGHAILRALGIRTAFRVLPTFDSWIRRTRSKEIAKSVLFRSVDAAKVPGPDGRAYALRYGLPPDRIFTVTQSVDVARFKRGIPDDERRRLRAELGVTGECLFLYVGRFWRGKGLMGLLDAFGQARSVGASMSLVLVGDGEDEPALRRQAAGMGGVVFHPFVQPDALPAYYSAADVFVFPTLGDPHGVVIEEAQAAGLPVLTSDAAGDVRLRVIDEESGFIVPAGDVALLRDRMLLLAGDPALRHAMGARGAQRAAGCGHPRWAADFELFVEATLRLPPRRTAAARVMEAAGTGLVFAGRGAARLKAFWRRRGDVGAAHAAWNTVVGRLNRLGLWLVVAVWKWRGPRIPVSRFGSRYGGWLLPDDVLSKGGVCYCAGVGEDTTLEEELLRRTDSQIWSLDPTPRAVAHVRGQQLDPDRFTFMPIALWDEVARAPFFAPSEKGHVTHSLVHADDPDASIEAPCATVPALMNQLGHDNLALLKLNIEGAEWPVLRDVIANDVPIRVLCVEFCRGPSFWRVAGMVRTLRRHGYAFLARDRWKFTFVGPEAADRGAARGIRGAA